MLSLYLPQVTLEVIINSLVGTQMAYRAHVAVWSDYNHGTFAFGHSVYFVSVFLPGNTIGSHLCQSLDRSWNVCPLEPLLERVDHDRIDDAVRIRRKCGFCGVQGSL